MTTTEEISALTEPHHPEDWADVDSVAVDTVRVLAADAVQKVGNGHPGTAMSLAPLAYTLFQRQMRHDPSDVHWLGRDLFILSCGLTQFMSNTASAALLCPIGIAISKNLGADPKAVLMAIAVAASCAFATPVGTPPNTLVLGPGGYKFMDYVKAGTGLVLVAFVVSLVVIPMVWPFFPGK